MHHDALSDAIDSPYRSPMCRQDWRKHWHRHSKQRIRDFRQRLRNPVAVEAGQ